MLNNQSINSESHSNFMLADFLVLGKPRELSSLNQNHITSLGPQSSNLFSKRQMSGIKVRGSRVGGFN